VYVYIISSHCLGDDSVRIYYLLRHIIVAFLSGQVELDLLLEHFELLRDCVGSMVAYLIKRQICDK